MERVQKHTKKKKESTKPLKISNELLKTLPDLRVVQSNLIFVVGLSPSLAKDKELLKGPEYFGQFGKVFNVEVNQNQTFTGPQGQPSLGAYVTFVKSEYALHSILALDQTTLHGRQLRVSLGTTKYCSQFLRGNKCNKQDCMYLHELGDPEASFTKEQMQAGKHTEYMHSLLRLHSANIQQNPSAALNADSTTASYHKKSTALPASCANGYAVDLTSGVSSYSHRAAVNDLQAAPNRRRGNIRRPRVDHKTSSLPKETLQHIHSNSEETVGQAIQKNLRPRQNCAPTSTSNVSRTAVDATPSWLRATASNIPEGFSEEGTTKNHTKRPVSLWCESQPRPDLPAASTTGDAADNWTRPRSLASSFGGSQHGNVSQFSGPEFTMTTSRISPILGEFQGASPGDSSNQHEQCFPSRSSYVFDHRHYADEEAKQSDKQMFEETSFTGHSPSDIDFDPFRESQQGLAELLKAEANQSTVVQPSPTKSMMSSRSFSHDLHPTCVSNVFSRLVDIGRDPISSLTKCTPLRSTDSPRPQSEVLSGNFESASSAFHHFPLAPHAWLSNFPVDTDNLTSSYCTLPTRHVGPPPGFEDVVIDDTIRLQNLGFSYSGIAPDIPSPLTAPPSSGSYFNMEELHNQLIQAAPSSIATPRIPFSPDSSEMKHASALLTNSFDSAFSSCDHTGATQAHHTMNDSYKNPDCSDDLSAKALAMLFQQNDQRFQQRLKSFPADGEGSANLFRFLLKSSSLVSHPSSTQNGYSGQVAADLSKPLEHFPQTASRFLSPFCGAYPEVCGGQDPIQYSQTDANKAAECASSANEDRLSDAMHRQSFLQGSNLSEY